MTFFYWFNATKRVNGWILPRLNNAGFCSFPIVRVSSKLPGSKSPMLDIFPMFLIMAVIGICLIKAFQTSVDFNNSVGTCSLVNLCSKIKRFMISGSRHLSAWSTASIKIMTFYSSDSSNPSFCLSSLTKSLSSVRSLPWTMTDTRYLISGRSGLT